MSSRTRTADARPLPAWAFLIELVMVCLLGLSLSVVILELFGSPNPAQLELIHRVDIVIGVVFLTEFVVRWGFAANRGKYMREYWWMLLAAIPISLPAFQILRTLRIGGLIRMARFYEHLRYERRVGRV